MQFSAKNQLAKASGSAPTVILGEPGTPRSIPSKSCNLVIHPRVSEAVGFGMRMPDITTLPPNELVTITLVAAPSNDGVYFEIEGAEYWVGDNNYNEKMYIFPEHTLSYTLSCTNVDTDDQVHQTPYLNLTFTTIYIPGTPRELLYWQVTGFRTY